MEAHHDWAGPRALGMPDEWGGDRPYIEDSIITDRARLRNSFASSDPRHDPQRAPLPLREQRRRPDAITRRGSLVQNFQRGRTNRLGRIFLGRAATELTFSF
jgi:hypothetical protein